MLGRGEKQIFLKCGAVDMRKQIDGLAMLVKLQLERDPMGSAMYVFCNKNRDRIKILTWDEDGFWVYFKRIEGGRYNWPIETEEEQVMELSTEEMEHLIGGNKLTQKLRRKNLSKLGIC
jgi:transposase